MPGTPTLFLIRDLVVERLASQDQAVLQDARQHINAEPAYSYFGALGVNLFDFMPTTPPGLPGEDIGGRRLDAYAAIWRELFTILSDPDAQDDPNRNILSVLRRARALVDEISEIADEEALVKFAPLQDRLDQFEEDQAVIQAFISRLTDRNLLEDVLNLIATAARPYAAVDEGQEIPPPGQWSLREHVSAFKTGEFAERLVERAREIFVESGDRRFLAYAYGFKIAYCGKAVGSPFINSIVGSVPRLHWWRSRWIERFVDAWAWGHYDPNRPEPLEDGAEDFENWRGLCNADLHKRIEIGALAGADPIEVMQSTVLNRPLPEAVPEDFRIFWVGVFQDVYGENGTLSGTLSLATEVRLNDALVWSWLTLWFTTGRDSLGCNPQPPVSIADGTAFFDPATADPFETPVDEGEEGVEDDNPLDVEPVPDPDRRRTVCGAILAFLGIVAGILGVVIPAIGAVVGGILLIIRGELEINWPSLRRDLYVIRWYLYNAIDGLNRNLVLAALAHPYPYELDDAELRLEVPNQDSPPCGFPAGPDLYSSVPAGAFPGRLWDANNPLKSWICPLPTGGGNVEQPATVGYARAGEPDLFIDALSDPDVTGGLILNHKAFPLPPAWPDPGAPSFASAVDNAIDVILREGEAQLPNLNLQGDRGIGFRAWEFTDAEYGLPVQITSAS